MPAVEDSDHQSVLSFVGSVSSVYSSAEQAPPNTRFRTANSTDLYMSNYPFLSELSGQFKFKTPSQ